jgi:polysaccharide biosynthesis transport protein
VRELSPLVIRRAAAHSSDVVSLPASPPPQVMGDGIGLEDCWQIIKRHSRLISLLVASALLVTGIVVFSMTPNFKASATLLIAPEPPRVLDIKALINEGSGTEDHGYYKTQFDILKSHDLAAMVIRQLDLMSLPLFNPSKSQGFVSAFLSSLADIFSKSSPSKADREREANAAFQGAIGEYLNRLKITPKLGSRLVVVSFKAPDPVLAQRVVHTHVRDYIRRSLDLSNESKRTAVEFLQKELVNIENKVQTSEAALEAYRRKAGIVSFSVKNAHRIAERRMEHLTQALTEVETKRIAAQAQVQLLRSGNYDSLPQVITNPVISALEPRVQQLEAQYADMATAFNPAYPKLAELKAELSQARAGLNRAIRQVADAVQRTYAADVDEENQLRANIQAEKERDFALNDASLRDAVLAREVETDRQLYKNVLMRMQQMAVGQQAPVSNISIVDQAVVPTFPSTPRKRRDLAISGLIALMFGLGLAFVLEHFDRRLKTTQEAEEYLQLPALAVAPDFARLSSGSPGSLANIRWLLSTYLHRPNGAIPALEHAASRGDVYRSVRTALLFSRGEPPPKRVLITSGIAGEGKTWTAVQTAIAFAQTGVRTLLLDADLRRSRCHEALQLSNGIGLSEVLAGRCEPEDAILFIETHNLFCLTAGSRVRNPSELLTSPRMKQLLDWLSRGYDQILIDSAPLTCASDTGAIATMTDGVVLVADANTPKEEVRRANDLLSFVGANVLGFVLNRVDSYHPDYKRYSRYYFSYDDIVDVTSSSQRTA